MVSFNRPVVGPKVYLSRGSSGHAETFKRTEADFELQVLLGKVTILIAVDGFLRKMKLARRIEEWCDVLGYLGDVAKISPDLVPLHAAVSFWAHVSLTREAANKTKKKAS